MQTMSCIFIITRHSKKYLKKIICPPCVTIHLKITTQNNDDLSPFNLISTELSTLVHISFY